MPWWPSPTPSLAVPPACLPWSLRTHTPSAGELCHSSGRLQVCAVQRSVFGVVRGRLGVLRCHSGRVSFRRAFSLPTARRPRTPATIAGQRGASGVCGAYFSSAGVDSTPRERCPVVFDRGGSCWVKTAFLNLPNPRSVMPLSPPAQQCAPHLVILQLICHV